MRLYKRGPTWWCSFSWNGTTIRRATRCETRAAAVLVAQRWERDRADPDHAAAALGHADTTMLHRVYGKPRDEAMGALLARQSAGLPRVRLVYVSEAERALPQPTASNATKRKHSNHGGPSGTRTRDLRIKRTKDGWFVFFEAKKAQYAA